MWPVLVEPSAQRLEVLDDAVVDHGDRARGSRGAGARCGRSGPRAWPSACGPSRPSRRASVADQGALELRELARPASTTTRSSPSTTATPAESYPRYSSRRRPSMTIGSASSGPDVADDAAHEAPTLAGGPASPEASRRRCGDVRRAERATHGAGDRLGVLARQVLGLGLDHDAHERLGAGRSHQDASVLAQRAPPTRWTASQTSAGVLERVAVAHVDVDQPLRVAAHHRGQRRRRCDRVRPRARGSGRP